MRGRKESDTSAGQNRTPATHAARADRTPHPRLCASRHHQSVCRTEYQDGKIIGQTQHRHRSEEFRSFLNTIEKNVPEDLDCHLVLDNDGTHKTPEVNRWLTAIPVPAHFTPTSASWLNLVERWFAELTTKKLRRGTHTSVRQLNKDIRAWIDIWNDNPRPYVWTKTADQILEAVANYCRRINDSRH